MDVPEGSETAAVDRVDKWRSPGLMSWAECGTLPRQEFEASQRRLAGTILGLVPEDQDADVALEPRGREFRDVCHGAAMRCVGRHDVHQHVVIRVSVVAEEPKQLRLDHEAVRFWPRQPKVGL
jgi:hypothetical protein